MSFLDDLASFVSAPAAQYGPIASSNPVPPAPGGLSGLQSMIGNFQSAIQPIINNQPSPQLEQLSKLAYVAPSIYGQAYASALQNNADPLTQAKLQQAHIDLPYEEPLNKLKLLSSQNDLRKSDQDYQTSAIEQKSKTLNLVGNYLTAAHDQNSWDQARQNIAQQLGPDAASSIPANYDPDYALNLRQAGATGTAALNFLSAQGRLGLGYANLNEKQAALESTNYNQGMNRQQRADIAAGGVNTTPGAYGPAPKNVVQNNPINLRAPDGSFNTYQSPVDGINAAASDLGIKISGQSTAMAQRFGKNYQPTLANVITTLTPPTENDTQGYIKNVSQITGIAPDQVLTNDDIPKLIPAIAKQEGGATAESYYSGANGDKANQTVAQMNADPQSVQSTMPPPGQMTPTVQAQRLAEQARHNQVAESQAMGPWQGAPQGIESNPQNLPPDQFLAQLPSDAASIVQSAALGETAVSGKASRQNAGGYKTFVAAKVINPLLTENSSKALADYRNPDKKSGFQIQTFNKVSDHIDDVENYVRALNNPSDNQTINKYRNIISAWNGGTGPTNLDSANQIVAGEIAKGIAGNVVAEGDRERAGSIFSNVKSTDQLLGGLNVVRDLMGRQMQATAKQYTLGTGQALGTKNGFQSNLEPAAVRLLNQASSAQATPNTAPTQADITAELRRRGLLQ